MLCSVGLCVSPPASEAAKSSFWSRFSSEAELGDSLVTKHDPVLSWSLQTCFSSQPPKAELTGSAARPHQQFEQPSAVPGPQTGTSWQK